MKTPLLAVMLTLLAGSGAAFAAPAQRELAPITVQSRSVDCTPPSAAAVCSALHAEIRREFTLREIGILFGARTSYPESQTAYAGLDLRYRALVREVAATFDGQATIAAR